MPLTSHDLKNRDCLYKKLKKQNKMKFNLYFVLLTIFAIIALTHPSAGSGCKNCKSCKNPKKPCCKKTSDCIKRPKVGVYCEKRIPCKGHPKCGTCRPVVPCRFPCCLKDGDCGKLGPHAHCNVKKPCGARCGKCERRHR